MATNRVPSILEKWLEDMPNSNEKHVKKERRYIDLFSSNNSNPLFSNQLTSAKPSSNQLLVILYKNDVEYLNCFKIFFSDSLLFQKPLVSEYLSQETNSIDAKSIKGIFGWSTVDDIPLPVILREELQLVPVRIVESKV